MPKLGRKWKKGQNIQHGDDLYNQPVGIGENTFVVLPETIEGTASVAAVDESGWIVSWFMRHESVEEAIAYVKEYGKPKGWEPEVVEMESTPPPPQIEMDSVCPECFANVRCDCE
jgi:hypothetical protein